jgi:hypothetical protein
MMIVEGSMMIGDIMNQMDMLVSKERTLRALFLAMMRNRKREGVKGGNVTCIRHFWR